MEVSALKYHGGLGLHARSPLLRLQSDERLIALIRRGNTAAFEVLVSRYETRLLAFCRHLLGSREDAEDVLQEVLAAAFNAILADDRPINVRPWLYRIARNRSLNHLRRATAIGVDSMDIHYSENGTSTADKVHSREEFRVLLGDIQDLPETQRTALVLREMDALSYEQIAETMETTVPSVKSLLVRARVSLAEAAEARLLSCDQVRLELGEVAEGLKRKASPPVRRHLRTCDRCSTFRVQLRDTNKALAALLPFGPLALLKQLAFLHIGHSAGSGAASGAASSAAGSSATAGGGVAAGSSAAAGSTAVAGSTAAASSTAVAGSVVASTGATGLVSAGVGAVATKAVAGLAAAALVTAGAVEVGGSGRHGLNQAAIASPVGGAPIAVPAVAAHTAHKAIKKVKHHAAAKPTTTATTTTPTTTTPTKVATKTKPTDPTATTASTAPRTVVTTDPTHCQASGSATGGSGVNGQTATAQTTQCGASTTKTTTTTTTTTPSTPACATPATPAGATTSGTSTTSTTPDSTTTPTSTTPATTTTSTSTTPDPTTTTTPSCTGTSQSPSS